MLELLFLLLPVAAGYGWVMGRNSVRQQQHKTSKILSRKWVTPFIIRKIMIPFHCNQLSHSFMINKDGLPKFKLFLKLSLNSSFDFGLKASQ